MRKFFLLLFMFIESINMSAQSKSTASNNVAISKPKIQWQSGNNTTSIPQYDMRVIIESSSRITSCVVKLNGAATKGTSNTPSNSGYNMTLSSRLVLLEGTNIISVEAENSSGKSVLNKTVVYNQPQTGSGTLVNEKRIALVIGNSTYSPESNFNKLNSALNDATDLSQKLKYLGFEVQTLKDATQKQLVDSFRSFCEKASNYDVALVFYSGHGLQYNKSNYIVPVDVQKMKTEDDIPDYCYDINTALNRLNKSGCKLKIILLDACRTSFLTKGAGKGLCDMDIASGTVIGYATQPNYPANDGIGRNSPYTKGLLNTLNEPGLNLYNFFGRLKERVKRETGSQNPMSRIEIEDGDFYFNPLNKATDNTRITQSSVSTRITNGDLIVGNVVYTMVPVKGGSFEMGAAAQFVKVNKSSGLHVHNVTVSDFSIGRTEVTQELWEAVMGYNHAKMKNPEFAMAWISWNECQEFISRLNMLTGKKFRLPTEAEWEYAARGGLKSKMTIYSGSNTIQNVGWFIGNSDKHINGVGYKYPNELGIYDMTGNVAEFCSDWYGDYEKVQQTNPQGPSIGTERVCRGGAWTNDASSCSIITRGHIDPATTNEAVGFRLVLTE